MKIKAAICIGILALGCGHSPGFEDFRNPFLTIHNDGGEFGASQIWCHAAHIQDGVFSTSPLDRPSTGSVSADLGPNVCSATYTLADDGIVIDFNHLRGPLIYDPKRPQMNLGRNGATTGAIIQFSVAYEMAYEITATYEVEDRGCPASGRLEVGLTDSVGDLFAALAASREVQDQSYSLLGVSEPPLHSDPSCITGRAEAAISANLERMSGRSSGTLVPGEIYELYLQAQILTTYVTPPRAIWESWPNVLEAEAIGHFRMSLAPIQEGER